MAAKQYKRSMKNMLIDKRFQLKYTLFVVGVSIAIFIVLGSFYFKERQIASRYGWAYYQERQTSTEIMDINSILERRLPEGEGAAKASPEGVDSDYADSFNDELVGELESREEKLAEAENLKSFDPQAAGLTGARDTRALILMTVAVIILVVLLATAGIYLTHRVAGPMFALRRFMDAARGGNWQAIRPFRKGDEFVHLSTAFRELTDAIRGRHRNDVETLNEVLGGLEEGDVAGAKEKLAAMVKDKVTFVGD